MIAAGVSAAAYAANGEWGQAGIMAAGIALAAVGAGAVAVGVKAARVIRAAGAMRSGARALEEARRGATNAAHAARYAQHLRQLEKYGKAGYKELRSGRIRYYGKLTPAMKKGEMAGRRVVREWDPRTGGKRTWHETMDHFGRTRQVRIMRGGQKVHYRFDQHGRYIGKWLTR